MGRGKADQLLYGSERIGPAPGKIRGPARRYLKDLSSEEAQRGALHLLSSRATAEVDADSDLAKIRRGFIDVLAWQWFFERDEFPSATELDAVARDAAPRLKAALLGGKGDIDEVALQLDFNRALMAQTRPGPALKARLDEIGEGSMLTHGETEFLKARIEAGEEPPHLMAAIAEDCRAGLFRVASGFIKDLGVKQGPEGYLREANREQMFEEFKASLWNTICEEDIVLETQRAPLRQQLLDRDNTQWLIAEAAQRELDPDHSHADEGLFFDAVSYIYAPGESGTERGRLAYKELKKLFDEKQRDLDPLTGPDGTFDFLDSDDVLFGKSRLDWLD